MLNVEEEFFFQEEGLKKYRWTEQCYQLFHADFESVSEMLWEVTATNS